ncbi:hypothetical protein Bca4012_078593 [Brassica carinata]
MAQAVEEWYKQMPIITRSYLTAAVVTTVGCSLKVYTLPLSLFSLSPSLFVLSEPEKRERRWYLCHYLNIISGRRNLYLRYCCKSMMLHERSSQEESLYSTGLSFFTPEMISDLRYLMYIAQVASNGRVLTWGAKGEFDAVLKFSGTVNRYVEYVHNFFHARDCWELSLNFLLHLTRSVLLGEFQKAVTGMEGADVLSSAKMF